MNKNEISDEVKIYCKMKYWTPLEASLIINGISTTKISDNDVIKSEKIIFMRKLVKRCTNYESRIPPLHLLARLKKLNVDIPDALIAECRSNRKVYRRNSKSTKDLIQEIDELNALINRNSDLDEVINPKKKGTVFLVAYASMKVASSSMIVSPDEIFEKIMPIIDKFENARGDRTIRDAINEIITTIEPMAKTK